MDLKVTNKNSQPKECVSVYAQEAYLKTLSQEYGWLCTYDNGKLRYLIAYVIKRRLLFKYMQMQTGIISIGGGADIREEQFFLNESLKTIKAMNLDFVGQSPNHTLFDTYPNGAIYAPFGSYRINLLEDKEKIWKAVHSKHKNVIRKAEKEGVVIKYGESYINEAIDLLNETYQRQSLGLIDKPKFIKEHKTLINSGNIAVFVAYKDNEPQGSAIYLYDKETAYYEYGGSVEHPFIGSVNFLHWTAINYFKDKGLKYYDFVGARVKPEKGSKLEGIQRFKTRFGGSMALGYLWKYPINKLKYQLFMFIYKRVVNKRGDIIDQERIVG